MNELVALYAEGDLTGRATGSAPRSVVRSRNLPHAGTAVLLRDEWGRVYVHRRTDAKDVFPGMHDVWAGGVVLAGEDPAAAAARELTEELGVTGCDVQPCLPRYWYADEHTNYLAFVFEAEYDPSRCGPIVHQLSEVAAGWWMELPDLMARLADPTWPFVPDGRAALEQYAKHQRIERGEPDPQAI